MKKIMAIGIVILLFIQLIPATFASNILVNQTKSQVFVDGVAIEFEAYLIEGNNYFRLRDIAKAVNGSSKQFDVSWDETNKSINLVSGKAYTVVGGELAKGDGMPKTAIPYGNSIYKDGIKIKDLKAYTINGSSFFRLKDLAEKFGITVTYNVATKAVSIDTANRATVGDLPQTADMTKAADSPMTAESPKTQVPAKLGEALANGDNYPNYYCEIAIFDAHEPTKLWYNKGNFKTIGYEPDLVTYNKASIPESATYIPGSEIMAVVPSAVTYIPTNPFTVLDDFYEVFNLGDASYIETVEFDGKTCYLYEDSGLEYDIKVYVWADNGIVIKLETTAYGYETNFAFKNLKLNGVTEADFEYPKGVKSLGN